MFKYKYNASQHTNKNGKVYKPVKGILTVPSEIKTFSHLLISCEKTDWKELGINAGLKDKDLKKFMGKNKEARQKQLDKLKEI